MDGEQFHTQVTLLVQQLEKVKLRAGELETLWAASVVAGNGIDEGKHRQGIHALYDQRLDIESSMMQLRTRYLRGQR